MARASHRKNLSGKKKAFLFASIMLAICCGAFYFVFLANLPQLTGIVSLDSLSNQVKIERDAYGVPTIISSDRLDAARATGFVHAQDRFFQMDLLRRNVSGELSELFGRDVLEHDKNQRRHQFRKRAEKILSRLPRDQIDMLSAYSEGVNEGLVHLKTKPFEYFFLNVTPVKWDPVDSILVGINLYLDLQDPDGQATLLRGYLKDGLPEDVYDFLVKSRSQWRAPMQEADDNVEIQMVSNKSEHSLNRIPPEGSFEYLKHFRNQSMHESVFSAPVNKGSNQWAISNNLTEKDRTILACDMHLDLSVPNIWYRIRICYDDVSVSGVGIPGTPLVAVGSNNHIAWGFTNSYVDTTDHTILSDTDIQELVPEVEIINIKGDSPVEFIVEHSPWGPVSPRTYKGRKLALDWVAYRLDCFNFTLMEFEKVKNIQTACAVVQKVKIPALNLAIADRVGNIGWTVVGDILRRHKEDNGLPKRGSAVSRNINVNSSNPMIINPEWGLLWTANNDAFEDSTLMGAFLNPIRAHQIHHRLLQNGSRNTIASSCRIQLDEEAVFFERWQKLLISSLNDQNEMHKKLKDILVSWDKTCNSTSLAYFWIREFRERVGKKVVAELIAPCIAGEEEINFGLMDFEEPVYLLATAQPEYLKIGQYSNWTDYLASEVDQMINSSLEAFENNRSWGQLNLAAIKHPFSWGMPFLSQFLDMPAEPITGDYYVPRVAASSEGASVRMVVSPGHEEESVISMPCGQSGHPLSKHYRDQHVIWAKGQYVPFLPGKCVNRLILVNAN